MRCKSVLFLTIVLGIGGCGGAEEPADRAADGREAPPRRETVFDPLTSTLDRAEGVQQTVDQQAAEQRRRIEDAER